MAETVDLSMFVERGKAGIAHMTLAVDGVACAGCIRKIESGLIKLPGVIDARLNFTQRRLAVDWREQEIHAADIVAAVEKIGYRAHPFAPERSEADESAQAKWLLKCLAVAVNEIGSGHFRGGAANMAAGQWDLVIELARQGERQFRSVNRIVLR